MQVVAVLPGGLEQEGAKELDSLGARSLTILKRGVAFEADLACFYRVHFQARLPFRLLRQLSTFHCDSPKALYWGVQNSVDWEQWLPPSVSFRVDVSGTSNELKHSHFTALQVKNALVDFQRNRWGERSDINLLKPDICFHLHLTSHGQAVLSVNGAVRSLHKRGYKEAMGIAPLKENLAAGLILMTNWDKRIPLVDPLCGSGTFLLEAASLALDLPPNNRRDFLIESWPDFDLALWLKEKQKANQKTTTNHIPLIIGCEQDPLIAKQANSNIASAGFEDIIKISNSHFRDIVMPETQGIVVCNPPYGKRIGNKETLKDLYSELSDFLKTKASGWELWLLSGNAELTASLRMKATKRFPINNGGIDCRWLNYFIR